MAVPKRRVSKARRDKRRSNVWKMEAPALVSARSAVSTRELTEYAQPAVITTASLLSRRTHKSFQCETEKVEIGP